MIGDPPDERAVLAFVRRNPGALCAEIAETYGTHPAFVTAILQGLRREGKARSTGRTRGTRWFVTS